MTACHDSRHAVYIQLMLATAGTTIGKARRSVGRADRAPPRATTLMIESVGHRGHLQRKYVLVLGSLVTIALGLTIVLDIWVGVPESRRQLVLVEQEKARAAANEIKAFVD